MARDRDDKMQRLIAAVGEILKQKGYAGLGVNKIALEARVSKELIYRYFGGLNNLFAGGVVLFLAEIFLQRFQIDPRQLARNNLSRPVLG